MEAHPTRIVKFVRGDQYGQDVPLPAGMSVRLGAQGANTRMELSFTGAMAEVFAREMQREADERANKA